MVAAGFGRVVGTQGSASTATTASTTSTATIASTTATTSTAATEDSSSTIGQAAFPFLLDHLVSDSKDNLY